MSNYIIFVRHGETDWNAEKRFQGGGSDVPLNEVGRAQAELVANIFLREKIARVFSSPLRRALQTAEVIGAKLGLAVEALEELRELSFGDYEGLLESELASSHGEEFHAWRRAQYTQPPPGGESIVSAAPRAQAALAKITPALNEGSVIVCAHQAMNMALKASLANDYSVDAASAYRQANNEVCYWEWRSGGAHEVRKLSAFGSLAGLLSPLK